MHLIVPPIGGRITYFFGSGLLIGPTEPFIPRIYTQIRKKVSAFIKFFNVTGNTVNSRTTTRKAFMDEEVRDDLS